MERSRLVRSGAEFLAVVLLVLMAPGCATDVANRYYGGVKYPPRDANTVEVLRQRPVRPFEVIADFQANGGGISAMRRQAAKIGADAVIVTNLGGYYSPAEQWAGEDRMSSSYSRMAGTAIKYR
jgi:hypothetical protein